MNTYVVKSGTHDSERFDPLRLHGSIVAACLTVRALEGEAHIAAERVCREVIDWLSEKTEVSSEDIHRVAAAALTQYHPDAAYMYEQQEMIV